jgi:hypothetical protein
MDRVRYEGYVAARSAIAMQPLDDFAADVLSDLAEGLLLARDVAEAGAQRERVPEALALLVERGDLTPLTATRFWVHLRACGPAMEWPLTWDRAPAPSTEPVVPGC